MDALHIENVIGGTCARHKKLAPLPCTPLPYDTRPYKVPEHGSNFGPQPHLREFNKPIALHSTDSWREHRTALKRSSNHIPKYNSLVERFLKFQCLQTNRFQKIYFIHCILNTLDTEHWRYGLTKLFHRSGFTIQNSLTNFTLYALNTKNNSLESVGKKGLRVIIQIT